ncbi:MAG: glycoside hydrolase family 2 protein, partial [Terriglobales bacterium]
HKRMTLIRLRDGRSRPSGYGIAKTRGRSPDGPHTQSRSTTNLLVALCIFTGLAFAEPAPSNLIANVAGRTSTSLDGTWNTIVDPYEGGVQARFYENAKPHDKNDLVEYDFDASQKLAVPGDWNSQRGSLFFYEGTVWYQRYFSYAKCPHTRLFLYFGAANYIARVWLNGEKIGEHVGGFTPFNFEVTSNVVGGQNSLVVEVNNVRHADGIPALNTDWWNYGGLTRNVALVEVPETFIQDYFVQLAKGSQDEIAGWVQLSGPSEDTKIAIEIPEAQLKEVVTADANGRAEFSFPAKLQLWSPESPKLYGVVISAAGDTVKDEIGFRNIETRGTQILLNGKPIFLRGISMHEEAAFRGGRAFSEEDDKVLLGWARELGCNFVRLAHYPYNESMTRLADRMGFLVWSEIPVYWSIAWENPATLENAKEQLRDEIARDHNRASVILWSLSNETPPSEAGRTEFIKSLALYVRQLDSTRLLTSALNHTDKTGRDIRTLSDSLGQYLDVLGLNEYLGWYEGKPEDADRLQWKSAYEKPVILSEFGAGALAGKHGDTDTRFTEEYQANVFDHQINMLKKIPFLAGMSPWVLMDFSFPAAVASRYSGFLQPQRLDFRSRTEEKGFLRVARLLPTPRD